MRHFRTPLPRPTLSPILEHEDRQLRIPLLPPQSKITSYSTRIERPPPHPATSIPLNLAASLTPIPITTESTPAVTPSEEPDLEMGVRPVETRRSRWRGGTHSISSAGRMRREGLVVWLCVWVLVGLVRVWVGEVVWWRRWRNGG